MCCLFGMIDYKGRLSGKQKTKLISTLSVACEVRGTDATGIAYNSGGRLRIYKRPLPAHRLHLRIPDNARVIMGHTRMTTQGSEKRNYNNHPFPGCAGGTRFALAHNGVLRNDRALRRTLKLPNTKIETDSYFAVQLIEQKKALNLSSLKYMAEQVEGSFAFTVLDDRDNLYFVKGDNPLCLYHFPKSGLYLYASTEDILKRALGRMKLRLEAPNRIPLDAGDMIRIDARGVITRGSFTFAYNDFMFWGIPQLYRPKCHSMAIRRTPEQEYVDELKSVAASFGYTPDDIDTLICQGFTTDELEELLYCGELYDKGGTL